jgi:tRNA-specific 2-thiouridylase
MKKKAKVFVGVSGGVDSSVALALLKEQGHDVTGVFLKVWSPDFLPCDWREERRSAMRVCATLGVPFLTLDCEKEYKNEVVDYMIREYSAGRVPNPDVFCNKYVKFGVFLKKALEMGAEYVATGHYARVREFPISNFQFSNKNTKSYELLESIDKEKDQSYFLYTLGQEELKHSLFPVGHLKKPEVRKLAEKFGLPTATKKDSQGLCFIGKVDMEDFLKHYISEKKGEVLNLAGEVVGEHTGAVFLTIGQRHGFTITKKTANDPRYFVVSKDIENNTVTVADKEQDSDAVFSTESVVVKNLHSISGKEISGDVDVRIRYRQERQECTVTNDASGSTIKFKSLQNAIAVGQSAVLYSGDVCLGGGIIEVVR